MLKNWFLNSRRGVGGSAGPHELLLRVQTNKQVESCFLNHNSSIHFCCTDSLLMIQRGVHSLSIIIWRIGGVRPNILLTANHVTDFPVFASGSG
jgi:hypothetical protein